MIKFLRAPLLAVVMCFALVQADAQKFWQLADASTFDANQSDRRIQPKEFLAFTVDTTALKALLQTAPMEFSAAAKETPLILELPMANGKPQRFAFVNSPLLEPALQAKLPEIRTLTGQGIDDPTATVKLDWTYLGLHVQVLSGTEEPMYIDPFAFGDKVRYMSYSKHDLPYRAMGEDAVLEAMQGTQIAARSQTGGICYGTQLRTYRLALSCTGEYAVAVAGSSPTVSAIQSFMTTTVNRVNGVYEKEIAARMTMVDNTPIIYTNGTTDPFTNSDGSALLGQNQTVVDNAIGAANYDIGHVFSTGGGGVAYRGSLCVNGLKAGGVTGSSLPLADAYDIDYVAHEMGHQFNGNHTFNATTGSCGGGNRAAVASVEPGSGITIMAYAGICGATNNLAAHSIPTFHAYSQNEIRTFLTSGSGATCGTATSTGNTIPTVNAGGVNYTIPPSTPFVLTGSGSDANTSEVVTYSWEEMDPGTSSGNWNYGNKPFFRSFNPTTKPIRYFPQLSDVVNNVTTIGETMPSIATTMTFRLTARDNRAGGGGVCSDDMSVTVSTSASPFTVSSQWGGDVWSANGTNQASITWDVSNTDQSPINCTNVSILFSADGGYTWPYTLVTSTPNDGSHSIVIPNIPTTKGRIMVKAVGNIFFAVNSSDITINSVCGAVGATVTPATAVTALAGNSALNLALSPTYSSFVPAGTITGSDLYGSLAVRNTATSGCASASANQFQYHTYNFSVSVSGSYTFTFSPAVNLVANLYSAAGYTPTSPCTNFLMSTATYPGSGSVTLNSSMSASLTAGTTYVLAIGTFSNTVPTLPATYKMNITTGTGGRAYLIGQQFTDPGAGFTYGYVVVNNATGNIVSIGTTSNLTNSSTYPPGQYTVYGLSYANAISGSLAAYVGGSFTTLANQVLNNPGSFCADLSKNAVTVNVTGVLPVQFTALKARKEGQRSVLDWGTASEQNSSHFIVQRSGNGVEFNTELGTVKAAGNSNTELRYNFVDVTPLKGWNYYRIKQVDLDGKYAYSNIAALNFNKENSTLLLYPNPAKDLLNMEYTSDRTGKVELQVIDSKGAVLMVNRFSVNAGKNLQSLNIAGFSQGMYMIKYIDVDGSISYSKFIKQ